MILQNFRGIFRADSDNNAYGTAYHPNWGKTTPFTIFALEDFEIYLVVTLVSA